ncbi:MAG: hypothetical protein EBU93_07235 [Chlamydiae bacterium]|nr:hypothetical protein [Chlamydiota bacterium]
MDKLLSESYKSINKMSTSPFIKFCQEKRDEVKAANPNANFGDVGMILASLWKEMNQIERKMRVEPRSQVTEAESGLRRSARLRNKRLGLNFWGFKLKK